MGYLQLPFEQLHYALLQCAHDRAGLELLPDALATACGGRHDPASCERQPLVGCRW